MDSQQNFYMLEVNTRVQVEHPVTELITGVDIVQEMIRVSAGEPLGYKQEDIKLNGHAIECRINAEDPSRGFMPQPGLIETYRPPGGPGVRLDSHAGVGYRIPTNYDSMIGKLLVHAPTRTEAIARMKIALEEFEIGPIKTTIGLHRSLLDNSQFVNVEFDIHYIDRMLAEESS